MHFKIVVFLGAIVAVHSDDLRCYQCNPTSGGKCDSPDKNHIAATVCKEVNETTNATNDTMSTIILEMGKNATGQPYCYFLYFETGIEEETGYYRGCSKYSEGVLKFCDALNERIAQRGENQTMKYCKKCTDNACNGENLVKVIEIDTIKPDVQGRSTNTTTVKNTKSGSLENVSSLGVFINLVIGFCALHF